MGEIADANERVRSTGGEGLDSRAGGLDASTRLIGPRRPSGSRLASAVPRQYSENRWWTCALQYQERRQCRLTSRVDDLIARNASQSLPMATSDSESNGLRPRISSFAEMDFFNVGKHHP